jgi:ketosteroid isomerase-like protein
MSERTQRFIDALAALERDGDADAIGELFADGASISNPMVRHDGEGAPGARAFWRSYRSAFDDVRSEFRNVVEEGDTAMLEWTSEGRIDGKPVRYGGVSVLEHGEGGIVAFRAYFNAPSLSSGDS